MEPQMTNHTEAARELLAKHLDFPAQIEMYRSKGDDKNALLFTAMQHGALDAITEALSAHAAGEIDARMKAAGMRSIDEMMSPMAYQVHAGMTDLAAFESWLERKAREYTMMQANREIDGDDKDEMFEWVLAHASAFKEALVNFHAAKAGVTPLLNANPPGVWSRWITWTGGECPIPWAKAGEWAGRPASAFSFFPDAFTENASDVKSWLWTESSLRTGWNLVAYRYLLNRAPYNFTPIKPDEAAPGQTT